LEKTFVKGLELVEALARSDRPRGVTELAVEMNLTKSNVHRLLKTLEHKGYLRRDAGTGHYGLSLKLWELGSSVVSQLDLRRAALPHLQRLADHTRETVHLSLLDGCDVVYVEKIDSPQPVRTYSRLGGRAPAYCVATGKAMLAFAPDAVIRAAARSIHPFTSRTVRNEKALRAELERVRAAGFAVNQGEWRGAVCGVAAPIRDISGAVIAATGVSGPAERLKPRRIKTLAPAVVAAADAISRALGYAAPIELSPERRQGPADRETVPRR